MTTTVLHLVFQGLGVVGAVVAVVGVAKAVYAQEGRFYRLVVAVRDGLRRRFPKLFPGARGRILRASVSAGSVEGGMTSLRTDLDPVPPGSSLEQRVELLEQQLRSVNSITQANEAGTATTLGELRQRIDRAAGDVETRARRAIEDLSSRLDQQSRRGLLIAAIGAVLVLFGTGGDFGVSLAEAIAGQSPQSQTPQIAHNRPHPSVPRDHDGCS